jgi:hypothetical protein
MTQKFYINEIIKILEREMRSSFVKFGYGDSDMYKSLKITPSKNNQAIIIRIASYELYLEYGTKYIKPKKIVTSGLRKAKPQINDMLDRMWSDFVERMGTNVISG